MRGAQTNQDNRNFFLCAVAGSSKSFNTKNSTIMTLVEKNSFKHEFTRTQTKSLMQKAPSSNLKTSRYCLF
jgi:hypothetical protein